MTTTPASTPAPTPAPHAARAVLGLSSGPATGRWRRWLGPLLVLLLLAGATAWWWPRWQAGDAPALRYVTAPATTGRLTVKVSATGNLQPTNQVVVGSELSGTVEAVYVDVNDRVKKGQPLARLDTTRLAAQAAQNEASVAQARAQVLQARATAREARTALQRLREVQRLSGGKVPAASEIDAAESALEKATAAEALAKAQVAQAEAALRVDRNNLAKATVRSAIDGVVLLRSVEPGQTVAASLQAPTLFTLAENLAQMELQVAVDEADVGQVQAGQNASFTVDAYPDRSYPARIRRVSVGSTTTNNVVSYATRLLVDNGDLSLRPGMTATAEILTLERDGVLLVPNAALRWQPPAAAAPGASGGRSSVVNALIPRPPRMGGPAKSAGQALKRGAQQTVWVLAADGQPRAVPVTVGPSDGRQTQVLSGDLAAGQPVITESAEVKR